MNATRIAPRPRPQRIELAAPPYAPETQAVLDRLPAGWRPPFALFTALARDGNLFQRFIKGAPIYFEGSNVALRQREVLLLRVTANCRCEYEWGLRIRFFAVDAGLDDDQIFSTVYGRAEDACWDTDDRLMMRLADALHACADIPDGLWGELSARHSPEAIMELLMLAGYYRMVAYLSNGLRLPLEPMAATFPRAVAA